jgi:hypothetical protein
MEIRRLDRIKILAFDYQVRWLPADLFGDYGRIDSDRLTLALLIDQPEQVLRDTILHEIIHALNFHLQLRESPSDEDIASRLSTGLLTVFRDNPQLASWLVEQK